MKYVDGLQGGQALQVPSSEYSLAGRALDVELAYQPWDGSYMYDKADEPFVELTIEGLEAQRNQEPSHRDIIAGARMLTEILNEAGFLAVTNQTHRVIAELDHKDTPNEHRELFEAMDVEAATAQDARTYDIGIRAGDLARRESIVLTPPVAEMTVNGLRRIATWHGPIGSLRYWYQQLRFNTGPLPQTASQLYARPERQIRERTVEALKSLDSLR